jgi:hypothetical protein
MGRARIPALAALALTIATAARAQMEHPAGMSHAQVIEAASAGGPDFISQNAAVAWIDSTGTVHAIRPGTNGFTCVIVRPDPFAGAICGDQTAAAWLVAMLRHDPRPPAMSAPGIAYMAQGGVHYEDAQGNVLMEHELTPHAAGARRVQEPPHWMLIWPVDPAASGLPTKENGAGTYVMFAGTPWAHLMVYQNPRQLTAPAGR